MDDFIERWKAVLSAIEDPGSYTDEACDNGWDDLPTKELPGEAQSDIDRLKSPITKDTVLVVNHGFGGYLTFSGTRVTQRDFELAYLRNIDRLLREKNPDKVDTAFFDYPELYVLDSRARLMSGGIKSVVLTEYDGGGSLNRGAALRDIGSGKRIYLAGTTHPCLTTTAEELWDNDNETILIVDAAIHGHIKTDMDLDKRRKALSEYLERDGEIERLEFTTTQDFLNMYGRALNR